jgi:hypothetical protein
MIILLFIVVFGILVITSSVIFKVYLKLVTHLDIDEESEERIPTYPLT